MSDDGDERCGVISASSKPSESEEDNSADGKLYDAELLVSYGGEHFLFEDTPSPNLALELELDTFWLLSLMRGDGFRGRYAFCEWGCPTVERNLDPAGGWTRSSAF